MKRIAAKAGGDTDTTRDYEYTDWSAVNKFALDFSKNLSVGASFDESKILASPADTVQRAFSKSQATDRMLHPNK